MTTYKSEWRCWRLSTTDRWLIRPDLTRDCSSSYLHFLLFHHSWWSYTGKFIFTELTSADHSGWRNSMESYAIACTRSDVQVSLNLHLRAFARDCCPSRCQAIVNFDKCVMRCMCRVFPFFLASAAWTCSLERVQDTWWWGRRVLKCVKYQIENTLVYEWFLYRLNSPQKSGRLLGHRALEIKWLFFLSPAEQALHTCMLFSLECPM